ncbi:MAG: branched-chain amino acid ABC transporter permease [Syntrophales bacterium]|jgi:branched-chain amino acid transport system permease protein|nr:branched-chain amino acid ABC transporter permease [Syntrophales bacterium]
MDIMKVACKKYLGLVLSLIFLILLITSPLYAPRYSVILLTSILMYIIITVSWVMFSGPTGYVSLAPAAFFGAGVYTSALLGFVLPLPVVVVIGGLVSFCLAILVGALTLRLKGIYFVMFTFGLVQFLLHFVLWWEVNITGTTGRVVPTTDNTTVYYYMLAIFVILILVAHFIKNSRFGLALQSIGEYEEAAAHTGINVTGLKISMFAISAFFMGTAGAIMATRWTYIDPRIAFNPILSFMPVLMAIFGGMGHLLGPVIGAAIFTYLEEFLITRFPYYYMLIFGVILLVAILYLPEGIVGLVQKTWKRISERKNADT